MPMPLSTDWHDGETVYGADLNNFALEINRKLRPTRNTIAAIGDSITAGGTYGWYQTWMGGPYLNQIQMRSHQRIRFGAGNYAVSGATLASMQATQLPHILSMNPLPGACVIAGATNDMQGISWSFSTSAGLLKSMVTDLLAVGIVPILWCPPPNNHDWAGNPSVATIHNRTYKWNTWIRRYAAANGFAVIDAHTALAQLNGDFIPGTLTGGTDLIHPTGYGHRLIAEQALADGLADIFPPNSLVNTSRNTDDLTNMLNNGTINQGLFTVDTNADGVADGLSASGAGTYALSLVDPTPQDQLMGKWQQVVVSSIGGVANVVASFTTGWSVGDTIAFSARIQTSGSEAALGGWHLVALLTDIPGGFAMPDGSGSSTFLWHGVTSWLNDMNDGELYIEFVIPTGSTDLQLWITANMIGATVATPLTLRVGEVTIRNLTTEGVLV